MTTPNPHDIELFDQALRRWDPEALELLIKKHPDILTAQNIQEGDTWLHILVNLGINRQCQWLLDHGADINSSNKFGRTPLHEAADLDDGDMIEFLLGRGANIEAVDHEGHTPFLYACRNGCEMAVDYLSRGGANLLAKNSRGYGALLVFLRSSDYADWEQANSLSLALASWLSDPSFREALSEDLRRSQHHREKLLVEFPELGLAVDAELLCIGSDIPASRMRATRRI